MASGDYSFVAPAKAAAQTIDLETRYEPKIGNVVKAAFAALVFDSIIDSDVRVSVQSTPVSVTVNVRVIGESKPAPEPIKAAPLADGATAALRLAEHDEKSVA
jgi:hypothetical protein